jgi:hypothetical protein
VVALLDGPPSAPGAAEATVGVRLAELDPERFTRADLLSFAVSDRGGW